MGSSQARAQLWAGGGQVQQARCNRKSEVSGAAFSPTPAPLGQHQALAQVNDFSGFSWLSYKVGTIVIPTSQCCMRVKCTAKHLANCRWGRALLFVEAGTSYTSCHSHENPMRLPLSAATLRAQSDGALYPGDSLIGRKPGIQTRVNCLSVGTHGVLFEIVGCRNPSLPCKQVALRAHTQV